MKNNDGFSSPDERAPPVHAFCYSKAKLTLRAPVSLEEWGAYHYIRISEIHNRYCKGLKYNFDDSEEKEKGSFRFVLLDKTGDIPMVIGVIRVDLLPGDEAALRWVAIHKDFQRKGYGTSMLAFAEKFIGEQNRKQIRVPAEEDSRGFYEKLGYKPLEWREGPHHPNEANLSKDILDESNTNAPRNKV